MADSSVNLQASSVSPRGARADAIIRILAMITLAMVGLQFLLAGFGAFGAGFGMHVMLGRTLGWFSLLTLIAVLVARAGKVDITIAVLVPILAIVGQGFLANLGMSGGIPLLGALHVLNGFIIGGLTSQLLTHANERQKQRAQAA